MKESSSWAPERRVVACLVLVAAWLAVPAGAQITFTYWDLPLTVGTSAGPLITEKIGSAASPLGAVWYSTRANARLIRFVPANPPDSGPATWTSWNVDPYNQATGLKVTPDGAVFMRTLQSIQCVS